MKILMTAIAALAISTTVSAQVTSECNIVAPDGTESSRTFDGSVSLFNSPSGTRIISRSGEVLAFIESEEGVTPVVNCSPSIGNLELSDLNASPLTETNETITAPTSRIRRFTRSTGADGLGSNTFTIRRGSPSTSNTSRFANRPGITIIRR